MTLPIYQIDAFTDRLFAGNPAAVVPLAEWLTEETMQSIAAENNLAETAFLVQHDDIWHIRWFTPTVEVDLCGHATLASAFVIFRYLAHVGDTISFHSHRSGPLGVKRDGELFTLDFPADEIENIPISEELLSCGQLIPSEACKGKTDYLLIFEKESDILSYKPDFHIINKLNARGLIISAPGEEVDFVSRFFAPQTGVPEDPVTGSAHTTLAVYWAQRLGKTKLTAVQRSKRGGFLTCDVKPPRVEISGKCRVYLEGNIFIS
jgi:PhzF family phenazine biosynthesis protein